MKIESSKINKIKEKHLNAYNWKSTEVPFGIWINDRKKHRELSYGAEDFHKYLFERQMTILKDTLEVGSDIVPVLGINNFGMGVFASLFGAEVINPGFKIDRIEEVGYWVEKTIHDIQIVNEIKIKQLIIHLSRFRH